MHTYMYLCFNVYVQLCVYRACALVIKWRFWPLSNWLTLPFNMLLFVQSSTCTIWFYLTISCSFLLIHLHDQKCDIYITQSELTKTIATRLRSICIYLCASFMKFRKRPYITWISWICYFCHQKIIFFHKICYYPPEGDRLYDIKVVSGYAFLRTYYV